MSRLFFCLLPLLLTGPSLAAPDFVHCYDFGCKTTRELFYSAAHWQQISAIFEDGQHDIKQEKQAIRRAISAMEKISGEMAGTNLDKGGNYPGYDMPRQMDCIDESTNTFQYLLALEEKGLLNWHSVDLKKRRIVWFIAHWTATIREIETGKRFAVDSWYRDNGEMPYLQPIADWRKKRDFQISYNPELAPD